jgi:hypothetical protein
MKLNFKSAGKLSRRATIGLMFGLAAVSITLMPGGEAQAIGSLRMTQVNHYDLIPGTNGLYYTILQKPNTASRRVPCSNDPGGYRNIYINARYVWSSSGYPPNEANFQVRYLPNHPSTAGNFVDDLRWEFIHNSQGFDHDDYRAVGTCVIAGTYYRIETDRRVTFRVYD